jgi:anti-sigma factor RsiW
MTARTHPEDLSPFVYGRRDHEEHAAICAHLELCAQCRAEVEEWRSLTALFRSPELEVDVSPGQWRRICERLEVPAENWSLRLAALLGLSRQAGAHGPRLRYLFPVVAALAILFAATGVYYQKRAEHERILSALGRVGAETEGRVENPFVAYLDGMPGGNPFESAAGSSGTNPFAGAVVKQ